MKNIKPLIILFLFVFSILACSFFNQFLPKTKEPMIEIKDDGSVEVNATAAAEAEFAVQTQIAGIEATQQSLIEKVEATAQALRPTDDPSEPDAPQGTPTPIDPKSYQTPPAAGATTVNVSANTNCRSGPGINYEQIDIVYSGQEVEVLGVDESGAYYIVRSPNGSICWLWSHYATLNGDKNTLALMTPPAPPTGYITDDWENTEIYDWLNIKVSDQFSWQGYWIAGGLQGQSQADWYNSFVGDCPECFRFDSFELEISRSGDFLDIVITKHLYWLDGDSRIDISYGIAQVSEDNGMAVGSIYLTSNMVWIRNETDEYAWDHPILWYQNGNPNQFVGDYVQWISCGAREGAAIPVPCTWP